MSKDMLKGVSEFDISCSYYIQSVSLAGFVCNWTNNQNQKLLKIKLKPLDIVEKS